MSRYARNGKLAKKGAVDSDYFGKPEQFEKDVQAKIEKTEAFKKELKGLILSEPGNIKNNYINAIWVLKEIKKEFNIIL